MNAQEAVQRIEAMPVKRQEPMDLLAMAVERGNVDVGTLERLMVVRKEVLAETAKRDFLDAMAAFQADCPIIVRGRAGHENRYSYAPLEMIVHQVTPFLTKHGFSHRENGIVTDGWVEAIVTVTHKGGHTEESRFKVPAESKAGMSPQQKYGAAMTYATRYAFCAAFGIRTADRDSDCFPASAKSVTELKKELWEVVKPVRGTLANWDVARIWLADECDMDSDKRVSDLNAEELAALIQTAKEKLHV